MAAFVILKAASCPVNTGHRLFSCGMRREYGFLGLWPSCDNTGLPSGARKDICFLLRYDPCVSKDICFLLRCDPWVSACVSAPCGKSRVPWPGGFSRPATGCLKELCPDHSEIRMEGFTASEVSSFVSRAYSASITCPLVALLFTHFPLALLSRHWIKLLSFCLCHTEIRSRT